MRVLELLAPARNMEIGIAAIDCGADAVYLAGPAFGARQAAGNSIGDIRLLCDYAHRFGAKVYVTLNTIIYDQEIDEAFSLACALQDAGADALIVQDLAIAELKAKYPEKLGIPLHASTQCSIRTVDTARRLESLGFSRIVLERELNPGEVRNICRQSGCEIEAFVHGALCVCFSGQCYLSAAINGRSANRGECIQACRSRYDLTDSTGQPLVDNGRTVALDRTLLSLKDLNMSEHLEEMADAGVMSFKIEGRLKGISYVRNIVAAYSEALDRIVERSGGRYRRASFGKSIPAFTPDARKSFNRGFTDLRGNGGWACIDAGKALGEPVGKVVSLKKSGSRTEITVAPEDKSVRLHNGDGFVFIGRDGRENGFRADIGEGRRIICGTVNNIAVGSRIWRNLDTEFEKEVAKGACRLIECQLYCRVEQVGATQESPNSTEAGLDGQPKAEIKTGTQAENIDRTASGISGGQFRIVLRAESEDGRSAMMDTVIEGTAARDRQRMTDILRNQLTKNSGIYSFSLAGIDADILPMLPASQINSFRRKLAELLDASPCRSISIQGSPETPAHSLSDTGSQDYSGVSGTDCRHPDGYDCISSGGKDVGNRTETNGWTVFPENADYRFDIANHLSAGVYRRGGSRHVSPAYELAAAGIHPDWADDGAGRQAARDTDWQTAGSAGRPNQMQNSRHGSQDSVELMRSRYCVLRELGYCRKTPAYRRLNRQNSLAGGIFLKNNGRLFRLDFDCTSCEMTVKQP